MMSPARNEPLYFGGPVGDFCGVLRVHPHSDFLR